MVIVVVGLVDVATVVGSGVSYVPLKTISVFFKKK